MNLKIRNLESKNVWDYENGFYWFSSKTRLNKMLSHYELYKLILNLPGDILELGVYKGVSLLRLATYRDSLENNFSRKIIGFDAFGKFPVKDLKLIEDKQFIEKFEHTGGNGLELSEISEIFKLKAFENIDLIKGNIFDTLPLYLKNNPATRISFLHLDMDVKEPTDFALELLFERVVPGGIVIFDDYTTVQGATLSVDEFLKRNKLKIEKLPFYNIPSFVRKPI